MLVSLAASLVITLTVLPALVRVEGPRLMGWAVPVPLPSALPSAK